VSVVEDGRGERPEPVDVVRVEVGGVHRQQFLAGEADQFRRGGVAVDDAVGRHVDDEDRVVRVLEDRLEGVARPDLERPVERRPFGFVVAAGPLDCDPFGFVICR
jgi:hypothetical protein